MSEDSEIDIWSVAKSFLDKIPPEQLIKLAGGIGLAYIVHSSTPIDPLKLPNALLAFTGYNIVINAQSEAGAAIGASLIAASGVTALGAYLFEDVKRRWEEGGTQMQEVGDIIKEKTYEGEPHYDEWLLYVAGTHVSGVWGEDVPKPYCKWLREHYPEAFIEPDPSSKSKCL